MTEYLYTIRQEQEILLYVNSRWPLYYMTDRVQGKNKNAIRSIKTEKNATRKFYS